MKHNTLCLIFLFFLNQVQSQLLFDVESFNFSEDTIISMTVGDPDNNGKDDIFVTVHNKNLIYKLQNNGTQFSKTPYLSKDKPELISMVSLNGGDDIAYTEKGKSTLNLLYGKDSYYTEKSQIQAITLDTIIRIKSIGTVNRNENTAWNRLLYATDQNNSIHLFQVLNGSFNSVYCEYKESRALGIPVSQACGYYFSNDVARVFYTDKTQGRLMALVRKWNNNQNPFFEPGAEIIDMSLDKPIGCLTLDSEQADDVMFVLDKGASKIIKYYLNENYRKEEYGINVTDPTYFSAGIIDNNQATDLIILDQNKLWLLTDLHEKGGQSAFLQTLIIEETETIKNLHIADFNGDGFTDIVYNLVGSNEIKLLKNEIKSSVPQVGNTDVQINPNPTHGKIVVNEGFDWIKVYSSAGAEVFAMYQGTEAELSHLPSGNYLVKVNRNGRISLKKLIIL